jgi:hypothetical protein
MMSDRKPRKVMFFRSDSDGEFEHMDEPVKGSEREMPPSNKELVRWLRDAGATDDLIEHVIESLADDGEENDG